MSSSSFIVALAYARVAWLDPTAPGSELSKAPPPAPGQPGFSIIAIALVLLSVALVLWRRRKGRDGIRRSSVGAATGNALMDLNAIYQPHHANAAVICKLEEEDLRDDAGEGPTPWTPSPAEPDDPYRDGRDEGSPRSR